MKRAELTGFIQGRIDWIQSVHRFNPSDGWNQVKGENVPEGMRAFGEFSALCDIVERFELAVNLDPPQLPEAKAAFQDARRILFNCANETSDSELRRLGYSREG